MAISTYAELKTAIATWLERSGDSAVTGNAADFVTLAESRLNRSLSLRAMETETTLTGTVSSRQLTLPSDYVEPKSLFLTTFGTQDWLRPFLAGTETLGTTNGTPTAWTINGTAIDLDRPCDQAHSFLFRYRQSFALSDAALGQFGQGTMLEAARLLADARVEVIVGAALDTLPQLQQRGEVFDLVFVDADKENNIAYVEWAITLAEPEGYVRIFVDEGALLVELLAKMKDKSGKLNAYIHKLLAAFGQQKDIPSLSTTPQPLIEPLSERELEVLHLIAQGLSNREISERLVLALSTVKGHNRIIFDKLQVQRRTEAVARARELGLI